MNLSRDIALTHRETGEMENSLMNLSRDIALTHRKTGEMENSLINREVRIVPKDTSLVSMDFRGDAAFIKHTSGQEAVFIALTSPCGGVGTSSLAVSAGRTLSRIYDRKALYIGFDALSSKCGPAGGADRAEFFRLMFDESNQTVFPKIGNGNPKEYVLQQTGLNRSSWDILRRSAIVSDEYGLDYLKCMEPINPLHFEFCDEAVLSQEAAVRSNASNTKHNPMEKLLKSAAAEYDYVLLDLPFCFVHDAKLMRLCEHIVLCYGIADESLYVHFAAAEQIISEQFKASRLHKFVCGRDEYSFGNGEADIHGEFGAKVRGLIDSITGVSMNTG